MLLSDPDNGIVLSAAVWCGSGSLNTLTIDDVTRYPFTTNPPYSGANRSSSSDLPVLALCTQLIDLSAFPRQNKSLGLQGNSVLSYTSVGALGDTIQIICRNHTVHIFQHCSDLQALIREERNAAPAPKISGRHLSMMRALVGFGAGKGGRWVLIGYIGSGGSSRATTPRSLLEIFRTNPYRHASPACNILATDRKIDSSGSCGPHPISAILSLFQALSLVPDILLPGSTQRASAVAESSISAFSLLGAPKDHSDTSGSSGTSSGFGFGFGMLSSKPRDSVGTSSGSGKIRKASTVVNVEKRNCPAHQALTARLCSLLTSCEGTMDRMILCPSSEIIPTDDESEPKRHVPSPLKALNSIDGEGEEEKEDFGFRETAPNTGLAGLTAAEKAVAVIKRLSSFSDALRPSISTLLSSTTAEQAAFTLQSTLLSFSHPRNNATWAIEVGDDIVLTYVLIELMSRLCEWCAIELCRIEGTTLVGPNMRMASVIADKLMSLSLDDSALNAVLDALSKGILKGITLVNQKMTANQEINERGSDNLIDGHLSKKGGIIEEAPAVTTPDSDINLPTPTPRIGGTCVANCLVSASQDVLYELFVLSALKSNLTSDYSYSDNSDEHYPGHTHSSKMNAEDLEKRRMVDIDSLGSLISPSSSAAVSGPGFDVFTLLATTQCSLWLVDVSPLGNLIGRLALQRFKTTKDSMDIFLEMVVAGQTDKLFMLAKADRNNTGKKLLDKHKMQFDVEEDGGPKIISRGCVYKSTQFE